jgi:hypothetical protein
MFVHQFHMTQLVPGSLERVKRLSPCRLILFLALSKTWPLKLSLSRPSLYDGLSIACS